MPSYHSPYVNKATMYQSSKLVIHPEHYCIEPAFSKVDLGMCTDCKNTITTEVNSRAASYGYHAYTSTVLDKQYIRLTCANNDGDNKLVGLPACNSQITFEKFTAYDKRFCMVTSATPHSEECAVERMSVFKHDLFQGGAFIHNPIDFGRRLPSSILRETARVRQLRHAAMQHIPKIVVHEPQVVPTVHIIPAEDFLLETAQMAVKLITSRIDPSDYLTVPDDSGYSPQLDEDCEIQDAIDITGLYFVPPAPTVAIVTARIQDKAVKKEVDRYRYVHSPARDSLRRIHINDFMATPIRLTWRERFAKIFFRED